MQSDAIARAQASAVRKMLDLAELTPETLAKTFKDFGESPEKLRALLNLWFVPWFKPTFVPDREHAVAGLRDVEFLGSANSPPIQLPYRMFDIETGNLVEFPAIGTRGQYCMLSHRWKGVELTLGYIKDARKKELDRVREARREGSVAGGLGRKSDVQLVLNQSKLDIEEQEAFIRELYLIEGSTEEVNIGTLLKRRLDVRAAEDELGRARDNEDGARSKLRLAEMEHKVFSHLIQMQDKVEEKMRDHLDSADGTRETPVRQSNISVGGDVVANVQRGVSAARARLQLVQSEYQRVQEDIKYFQHHAHLRDALDNLICRLQRWKSAIKLDRSIQEADRIFRNKLFQHCEKCYLWTDTCCIDKTNGGELSESLSLMGDWYASAEYTLVQLDTRFCEADAMGDWHHLKADKGVGEVLPATEKPKPNIADFDSIKGSGPEWSTRAWTLQELVMSKTTFYVNSSWEPLSRPVESLGYFYYLIPFFAQYTRGVTGNIYDSLATGESGLSDIAGLENVLRGYDLAALAKLERCRSHIKMNRKLASGGAKSLVSVAEGEAAKVETAQLLIAILEALGIQTPSKLSLETATSEITRAVYLATADLARTDGKDTRKIAFFAQLKRHLPAPDLSLLPSGLTKQEIEEEVAQHAINYFLQLLVTETEELVLADRQYAAEFGQLQQLDAWQQGICQTGFSAQNVLEVSGKRFATVATDQSYALMGILGVRFPTFPAEGYAKALSRLLDEVVVTRNDISVFNWTGMDMGSPIRGRSMYPSSHMAYGNQEDRGRRYNLMLSARVQDRMENVMVTYHRVIQILRSAIDCFKDKERKTLPLSWIERIVQLVLSSSFRELKPQQRAFEKIVGYILEHCRKEHIKLEVPTGGRPVFKTRPTQGENLDIISPNPIIINNSGIEGLLDIQRVIVTMVDPDKLRRQIAKAASPNDKISGWCSISTGFARVVTSFACTRRILDQELDVIESVEAQVLREQDRDKNEKRAARLLQSLSVTKAAAEKTLKDSLEGPTPDATDRNTIIPDTPNTSTAEERLISRMITFIQEPSLSLVAGEWVLARFAGTPGANWFLCHLELGPVPGEFYGHRIAAGAIDFHDSTPEPGLVNAWQTYMERKKRKMCYILKDYIDSRTTSREGEEKLRMGKLRGGEGKGRHAENEESGNDSDEEGDECVFDKVFGQGKLAAKALGDYTVAAVAEKLFEMRADYLDKTLATAVLKRTPKSLRTAVENMDDNKSFLPAMFHSSTRVHMF
ncbi:hypothetical protein N0V88_007738 [Collariella sp. IMI 366227]|nr:hypothetical protein N0V88_007738 [Collariella sp. IMI 366227]